MADKPQKTPEGETVQVPMSVLTKMQEDMASLEKKQADLEAKNAGLEEMVKSADTGEPKLREKKTFEPKFRTVRIRKFPKAGGPETDYVVGWTNKGAYQEVDRSGVTPQVVDYIEILFLGDRTTDGPLKAEKVRLLDLLNKGEQVHCKIVDSKRDEKKEPTGEEINVSVFDPQHGMVSTGETVDCYVTYSEIKYQVQIPGIAEPVWIDAEFCN